MLWTLAHKVSAALLAILICMMAATCTFAYWKLEDILSGMVRSRYGVVIESIKSGIEDRNSLGIPLYQQHSIQDQLERYKIEDVQILDIEVFNVQGDILYNSDRGAIGGQVPKSWLRMMSDPNWNDTDGAEEEGLVVGAPIIGAFDQAVGGVVLRYPVAYLDGLLGGVLGKLAVEVSMMILLFGILAVVGSVVLLKAIRTQLRSMEVSMSDLVTRDENDLPPTPDSTDMSFDGCFRSFEWRTHDVVSHLNSAITDVERLDRLA